MGVPAVLRVAGSIGDPRGAGSPSNCLALTERLNALFSSHSGHHVGLHAPRVLEITHLTLRWFITFTLVTAFLSTPTRGFIQSLNFFKVVNNRICIAFSIYATI